MGGIGRRQVLTGLLALPAATRAAATAPRPFLMGVTRWPADLTLEAVMATQSFIEQDCDMAAPMILGGVPWTEALSGAPYSPALMEELSWKHPPGHKLLLSLGALDQNRAGLAPYYGSTDNQPLPAEFAGLAFDDPKVIAAYTAFCLTAIEVARPDWLAIGVEVNILLQNNPAAWPAYKHLHSAVYRAIKARHPAQQVALTVEALHLLGHDADAANQQAEVQDLARDCDLIGVSLYPHMTNDVPRPLPPGWMDFMGDLGRATGKPVAVTESGYTSQDVPLGWFTTLYGTPQDQANYLDMLLQTAARDSFVFVVNFCSHDYDPLLARLEAEVQTLASIWAHCGILTSSGAEKPATAIWRRHFA